MNRIDPKRFERVGAYASTVAAFAALLAVAVAIYLAQAQLRESRDEAKIQHLVDEETKFDQPPLLKARRDLAANRIDSVHGILRHLDIENPPQEVWDLVNFCDHLGLLTRRGYLEVHDVWGELGYWLLNIYADARPAIDFDRKENPDSMTECSWLIEAMRPIEAKENAGKEDHPSQDDLYRFYDSERDAEPGKLPPSGHSKK